MWRTGTTDPLSDDAALVRRMRSGDEGAFEEFFDANFQGIYRFALSRLDGDVELAKELAQATICRALEKLDTWRAEAPLFQWLCSICRFEISGHFRRERRFSPLPAEVNSDDPNRDDLLAIDDDPESGLLRSEISLLVHAAVDRLPAHYAAVLERKYTEGLSVNEIAARLATSPKAVESLLTRARQAFRDEFTRLGGLPGTGAR